MLPNQNYCLYYKAHVNRQQAWFFVAVARSFEHVMFDRTLDVEQSIFEFFVPHQTEPEFLCIMKKMEELGVVSDLHKLVNRLALP